MRKIGFILILIIILPIAFLLFNEVGKLNENEKVLEQIYNNQLQAILFSVNQYSEDVVRAAADKILDYLESSQNNIDRNYDLNLLSTESKKFKYFFVADSINANRIRFFFYQKSGWTEDDSLNRYFKNILLQNDSIITRLYNYRNQGYRKIEPILLPGVNNESLLIFVGSEKHPQSIIWMVIDPNNFITQILSSRLQEVAKQEFVISVINP